MDKADNIPDNAKLIWKIAMTNTSREQDWRLILCRNFKEYKELCVNLDKGAWEYKSAIGKLFKGDSRQILWEGLDVETKSMIMQKGFMNVNH